MCGDDKGFKGTNITMQGCASPENSEYLLASMIREDLGVSIEPQALRMFIRHRFERVAALAHRIHDGKR